MCGFVVTSDIISIEPMIEAQKMRGPDDTGIWKDGRIAMGHVLLDINGEHQVQPFVTKKGNIMVFNGEMYDSNIANDTAFLAHGFETYGHKFVEFSDFHGSFVFYKPKEGILYYCRDHFGTKPLWYGEDANGNWTLSTSLKSFIHKRVDQSGYPRFLRNPQWPQKETPYKNVWKTAPGQISKMNLNTGNIKSWNLWDYYKIKSEKYDLNEFRSRLVTSVRKIAKSKQKTALFLSGGLDSTCALGIIKDMDIDLNVYICDYDETKSKHYYMKGFKKESDMAVKTCEEWGVPYKRVVLKQKDGKQFGQQWQDNTHYSWTDWRRQAPRYLLNKTAAADGCKVVITGDSADELFSGYNHHAKRFTKGYDDETLERAMKQLDGIPPHIWSDTDHFNNGLLFDLIMTSEQNILATDQTAGMFGMESRPVYLGQNFVRWHFHKDGKMKMKQKAGWPTGTYKYFLREVMADFIPEHVRNRKNKLGWSSPWDNNHKQETFKDRTEALLRHIYYEQIYAAGVHIGQTANKSVVDKMTTWHFVNGALDGKWIKFDENSKK